MENPISDELKKRTKKIALNVIDLIGKLPKNNVCNVLGNQLLRSGTSVAANYRALCKARSRADFISKIGIVEEEADESLFWLELFDESGQIKRDVLKNLLKEADELTAIFTRIGKTTKANSKYSKG
jgi:four helix bundle protein